MEGNDLAGRLSRKLLFGLILISAVTGWIVRRGHHLGLYNDSFQQVFHFALDALVFTVLIWRFMIKIRAAERTLTLANRKVLEQSIYFETVFRSLPDAAFIADPNRVITLVNPAAEKVFHGRKEIYLHQSAAKLYERPEDFREFGKKVFNPDTPVLESKTLETRFRRADGKTFEGELTASVLRDPEGKVTGFIGIIRDVTEKTRVQSDLRKTIDRLEEEQGLRERFVASLTHDLRNPLSAANALVQLGSMRYGVENPTLNLILSKVRMSLDRVDRMMRNLLDASRIRAGQPIPLRLEPCQVKKLIDQAVEGLRAQHGDRFVVDVPEWIEGVCDSDALLRVIENLVGNAVKYGHKESPVIVRAARRGSEAWISVHNEGRAISPEDQASLFEPFIRASTAEKSGKRGWGIGLSLVRAIVEAHGGSVQVDSGPDRGTTFTFKVPCVQAQSKRA